MNKFGFFLIFENIGMCKHLIYIASLFVRIFQAWTAIS